MRIRLLVLCVVLSGAALGAAGCSSPGAPDSGAASSGQAPAGKPTGTVTVRSGGKVVCVITLDKNGTGTCKVDTANYKPGKVTFTGTYNGTGEFKPGSGSTTLTLRPAKQAA
jgi:hypothetical protein